ncbi:hypothetical protein BGAL_0308g00010 [Botrytis galanthina]|uniref:Uncharacterized protein n=1 Tax=Botrytis galanthina TaxID=278940 RepID=A0A4S8R2Y8_9HELO|nr:hypothetical protein BGAL_0308g00010 [Botrytis galanthina]
MSSILDLVPDLWIEVWEKWILVDSKGVHCQESRSRLKTQDSRLKTQDSSVFQKNIGSSQFEDLKPMIE